MRDGGIKVSGLAVWKSELTFAEMGETTGRAGLLGGNQESKL